MGYPDMSAEKEILRNQMNRIPLDDLKPMMEAEDVIELQHMVRRVKMDDVLLDYLLRIVNATRKSDMLELGVSPRASLSLMHAAQARALLEERDYCIPDDIKNLVVPVFAHRIVLRNSSSFKRPHEVESALEDIVKSVEVPI